MSTYPPCTRHGNARLGRARGEARSNSGLCRTCNRMILTQARLKDDYAALGLSLSTAGAVRPRHAEGSEQDDDDQQKRDAAV